MEFCDDSVKNPDNARHSAGQFQDSLKKEITSLSFAERVTEAGN